MIYRLNGRPVELEARLEDGEPFILSSNFTDGKMEDLTDSECDEVRDGNYEELWCDLMGSAIDRAHDYAQGMER